MPSIHLTLEAENGPNGERRKLCVTMSEEKRGRRRKRRRRREWVYVCKRRERNWFEPPVSARIVNEAGVIIRVQLSIVCACVCARVIEGCYIANSSIVWIRSFRREKGPAGFSHRYFRSLVLLITLPLFHFCFVLFCFLLIICYSGLYSFSSLSM